MAVAPSNFGLSLTSVTDFRIPLSLPYTEAIKKWCNWGVPRPYHKMRARAHVNAAVGETLVASWQFNNDLSNTIDISETNTVNAWSSTWATAGESNYLGSGQTVPEELPLYARHRFYHIQCMAAKVGAGDVEMNGVELGIFHDDDIDAGDPDAIVTDRTGAHHLDAYASGSAWHVAYGVLGTLNKLLYESEWRISCALLDSR